MDYATAHGYKGDYNEIVNGPPRYHEETASAETPRTTATSDAGTGAALGIAALLGLLLLANKSGDDTASGNSDNSNSGHQTDNKVTDV